MTSTSTILLQQATSADDAALRDLAQLDSARPLARPAVLAIVDGRLIAAASVSDERIIADPFADTTQAVRMLRLRLTEISARRHGNPRFRAPRLSLRPRAAV
ncbi:hypothetical protein [Baekduia sp. Peel2402]|uniref:hypothetical protein n=1 Tax=Baekduia sp. Peel2402 TaxID=3458296 RepID=UPI00403EF56C